MKKKTLLICILLILTVSCRNHPTSVPEGTWNYDLFMNGILLGEAEFTNKLKNNKYISTVKMEMKAGHVLNTTNQKTIETINFKPVSLEIKNTIKTETNTQNINTKVFFKNNSATIDTGVNKATVELPENCMLDGNYFINELIKNKFRIGTTVKAKIFEPSVDLEEPVQVIIKIVGQQEIPIRGEVKKLMHVIQAIENYKSVDMYLNKDGVVEKAVIIMLNNKMEIMIKP